MKWPNYCRSRGQKLWLMLKDLIRHIGDSFIYFIPGTVLFLIVLDSYQMDFRAFYVGGKSVLYHLDPYLNHVTDYPELFDSGNKQPYSRFRYLPIAALFFMPFAFLSYGKSKMLYSLLIGLALLVTILLLTKNNNDPSKGEMILFILFSLPTLANFERGQIDLIILSLLVFSFHLYTKERLYSSAFLLSLAISVKIVPVVLVFYFLFKKDHRYVCYVIGTTILFFLIPLLYFDVSTYENFFKRNFPFAFGSIIHDQPIDLHSQQIVNNQVISRDIIATYDHNYVWGMMNPFGRLWNTSQFLSLFCAFILGILSLTLILYLTREYAPEYQFYAALPTINFFNVIAFMYDIVWYFPLFISLYPKANNFGKLILLIPLFTPASWSIPFGINALFAFFVAILFSISSVKHPNLRRFLYTVE